MFTKRGNETRDRIYRSIRSWTEKHGYPPSIREICRDVGLASTKAVKYHLDVLASTGVLRRRARLARALETTASSLSLPVLGRIPAGQPLLAVENVEESFALSRFQGCFLLRVKGDSMNGAGIMDSDMVVVQPQEFARNGDIVVALIDSEATVKRFRRETKEVILESENPKYPPLSIVPSGRDFRIVGRVVGVVRTYQ
jgi:repressor LexA